MLKQKTVYFREEDLEAWEKVHNKAEFLHNALNVRDAYVALTPKEKSAVKKHISNPVDFVDILDPQKRGIDPKEVILPTPSFERLANGLCKIHGTPLDDRGRCMQKGCKYAWYSTSRLSSLLS